jgi:hypothetical protein
MSTPEESGLKLFFVIVDGVMVLWAVVWLTLAQIRWNREDRDRIAANRAEWDEYDLYREGEVRAGRIPDPRRIPPSRRFSR